VKFHSHAVCGFCDKLTLALADFVVRVVPGDISLKLIGTETETGNNTNGMESWAGAEVTRWVVCGEEPVMYVLTRL